jgi:Fe-S cluster assembly ATP-binding protein
MNQNREMLAIKNLHACINEKEILKGIELTIRPGEIHAIMGPNGSGKSTLANILAGREYCQVTQGSIMFENQNVLTMAPEERAQRGIFLAFQYPVEIPGVNNAYFLKAALNAQRQSLHEAELDAVDFLELAKIKLKELHMDESILQRSVNEGFSGGEKKKNEILQLVMLNPKLAILDETDSGLDIDALKIVAAGINAWKKADRSVLMVTHYQRLLDYITPDYIHVLIQGKIVKTGGKNLALELEQKGYGNLDSLQLTAMHEQRQ